MDYRCAKLPAPARQLSGGDGSGQGSVKPSPETNRFVAASARSGSRSDTDRAALCSMPTGYR
jgi:hypothetical protein